MARDKKIKDALRRRVRSDRHFEDFCAQHNIYAAAGRAVCRRRFRFPTGAVASFAVVLAAVLSVSLPFVFGNTESPSLPSPPPNIEEPVDPPVPPPVIPIEPELPRYSANDVKGTDVTLEQLNSDKDLFLFDFNCVARYSYLQEVTPLDGTDLRLGYSLKNVLYGFDFNSGFFAYDFDYIVRCYERYDFVDIEMFTSFDHNLIHNDLSYEYKIQQYGADYRSLIKFKKGSYEYFLTVREFQDMTEINDENIEVFIKNVL